MTALNTLLSTTAAAPAPATARTEPASAPRNLLNIHELLTMSEAMAITRLSRPTLYRYAAAGSLTLTKFGGRTFIRSEELERFIAEGVRDAAR